jgi:OOP family OmpA-OmpF porin
MRNTLLLIMLYCSIPAWAQINLVPNPSFEDTLNCDSFKTYHAGFPWFTPTNCTPDYYYGASPTCGTSAFQNPAGYQLPYDGIAYIGLYATDGTTTREYICIELNDTLLFNKDYFLEFYVSRANQFSLATDDIGAHLSTLLPINTGCYYLPYLPQVENPQGNIITDSLSWTRISGVFTAQGGEKYLTIGNFKDSSNTTVVDADNGNGVNNSSYYYIDKVFAYSTRLFTGDCTTL